LNQESARIDHSKPSKRALVEAIKVVNQHLPKRDPETGKCLQLYNLEATLLEQILQTVSAKTIEISRFLMKVPDERDAVDRKAPCLQNTMTLPQRLFRLFQVLKDRGTQR
jgi:hypothetical protein